MTFEAGHQFWTEKQPTRYAAFPLRGVISLQASTDKRKGVEVAQVGPEGFTDVSLLLGSRKSDTAAVALTPGEAVLLSIERLRDRLQHAGFRTAAGRYCNFLVVKLSQISTCNRVHGIESALVARLLLMHDRTEARSFPMTQGAFASHLGVRRASVSRCASGLQKHGAIAYGRSGHLMIVDRAKLERFACSCYWAIKNEFDALLKSVANSSMIR